MGLFERFLKGPKPSGRDPHLSRCLAELKDPDWRTRKRAAETLGGLGVGADEVVAALEAAIADENGDVCLAASEALCKIRAASP
jgi:HEAT repeat protein